LTTRLASEKVGAHEQWRTGCDVCETAHGVTD
jgi:hypothetical protein